MQDPDPRWKSTKLSLERPYKDDNGLPIPTLLDITPDGQFIYEPREDWDAKLGQRFRRIFAERGIDFFDRSASNAKSKFDEKTAQNSLDAVNRSHPTSPAPGATGSSDVPAVSADHDNVDATEAEAKPMTPEMLFKMRSEILPRLHVALGEMTHAHDLLSLLLSASTPAPSVLDAITSVTTPTLTATSPNPALAPGLLTASLITPLPPISSVQAFNAQLVVGGKDEALRKASDVLRVAAEGVERSATRSESYWADALRIRRANWGLITAPLPLGAPTGRGADKTSKDFFVSYGLEQSPPHFRRKAIAHMAFYVKASAAGPPLVFPHRDRTRLRVSLSKKNVNGLASTCHSRIKTYTEDTLDGAIRGAQKEVVEQEIFAELINEAGNLPTASARVSERLIVIDAAQDVELRFELIDEDLIDSSNSSSSTSDASGSALCDLIASSLPVLLLRQHSHAKSLRLGLAPSQKPSQFRLQAPLILQPITDLLQFHVFLARVREELDKGVRQVRSVGVKVDVRFEGVGESGKEVVHKLLDSKGRVGGEAVLRIDEKHSIRFTFTSPSSLIVHLPQATIHVVSIPQLSQLLVDEIERSLLGRICEIGVEVCQSISGTWFVDEMMCRAVGRWEGCALNFRVKCGDDLTVDCYAHQLLRSRSSTGTATTSSLAPSPTQLTYGTRDDTTLGLFEWVRHIIEGTLGSS